MPASRRQRDSGRFVDGFNMHDRNGTISRFARLEKFSLNSSFVIRVNLLHP